MNKRTEDEEDRGSTQAPCAILNGLFTHQNKYTTDKVLNVVKAF